LGLQKPNNELRCALLRMVMVVGTVFISSLTESKPSHQINYHVHDMSVPSSRVATFSITTTAIRFAKPATTLSSCSASFLAHNRSALSQLSQLMRWHYSEKALRMGCLLRTLRLA